MVKVLYLLLLTTLTSTLSQADTIRIGSVFYRDVYIRQNTNYYYVYHPEEGKMERISRRRSNISEVKISPDSAFREKLLERYHAVKSGDVADKADSTDVKKLDGSLAKHSREMRDLAVFESQLAHWQGLSPETQQRIEEGLVESLELRTESRVADHAQAVDKLDALGTERATVANKLASVAALRARAVRQAQSEDESDTYLRAYENSKGYIGPIYQYYRDKEDRLRAIPTWWYTEDPSLYHAALAEREKAARRIGAADQHYNSQAKVYGSELNKVEQAMTQRERDARAALSKAADEQRRYGERQARVAALREAADADYQPYLASSPIASWTGAGPQRTPEFTVGHGLWRLDCFLYDGGSAEGFAVTVFNAVTGMPFTRLSRPDFLGMRSRVFDEPGSYYLEVQQGHDRAPYALEVSALAVR